MIAFPVSKNIYKFIYTVNENIQTPLFVVLILRIESN